MNNQARAAFASAQESNRAMLDRLVKLERERNAARARVAELETELIKVKGHRAAPAAEAHEVDVRPMTDDEIRAERLTQPAGDPWLARCTCGAEMLPLYPGEANAWEQGHLGTRPVLGR
jgi:hypothetical protein